jgi:long-subunit fatty acid transport protein
MKSIKYFAIVFIFSSISIFSQPNYDIMINPFWDFYSNNYLNAVASGKGYTGISENGTIASTRLNPASLDITNKFQADLQYTYKTKQPWLESLNIDDIYLTPNLFSLSAGFAYKINKNFNVGILYSNPSSITVDLGKIIKTNEFGQEIGSYEAYEKYETHSFSVPVACNIENFRFGVNLNYTLHRRYMSFQDSIYTGKFDKFNFQAGIIYRPIKQLSFGASFTPQISGNSKNSFEHVAQEEETKVLFPMTFTAGFDYMFKGNFLKIAGDYTYVNLSAKEDHKDRNQVHLGIEYIVNKNWVVRTGFFTFSDPRDLSGGNWGNPQDNYDQVFLTFGSTYKIKGIGISLAIMDSHISSGVIKNTFGNAGLTYDF